MGVEEAVMMIGAVEEVVTMMTEVTEEVVTMMTEVTEEVVETIHKHVAIAINVVDQAIV